MVASPFRSGSATGAVRESLGDRLDDHDSALEIELALRLLKAFEGSGSGDPSPAVSDR